MTRNWVVVSLIGLLAADPAHGKSSSQRAQTVRVGVGNAGAMRQLLSTGRAPAHAAANALHGADRETVELANNIHLLMSAPQGDYERALISPDHVALVRKTGVVDVIRRADAISQVRSGKAVSTVRVNLGPGALGMPVTAEPGPGDTLRLYRQLPAQAAGEIASKYPQTSFSLVLDDAYHPFDAAGKTITLAVPRLLFQRAISGEIGGAGWLGGGVGIDVPTEVQIDSRHVRELTQGHASPAPAVNAIRPSP